MSGPGLSGCASLTVWSFGSTLKVHSRTKAFVRSRFSSVTSTGPAGSGKRNDSSKVRARSFESCVSSHSPKIELNPRE